MNLGHVNTLVPVPTPAPQASVRAGLPGCWSAARPG